MNRVTIVFRLMLIGLLCGCFDGERSAPTRASSEVHRGTYAVRLVFVDCYDPVQLTINGVQIANRRFETESETGLSGVINADLKPRSSFHLISGDLIVDRVIGIDAATRIVYINPHQEPYIEASTSDTILLD